LAGKNALRTQLVAATGTRTVEALDFPKSAAVRDTARSSPLSLAAGLAYERAGEFAAGAGYGYSRERQVIDHAASAAYGARQEEIVPSSGAMQLGGEFWISPSWALRAGVASNSSRVSDNDPASPAPGKSQYNPIQRDTALSIGVGRAGAGFSADLAVVYHLLSEDPEPDPPVRSRRSATEIRIGGKYAF
jgi:hypothetical protein